MFFAVEARVRAGSVIAAAGAALALLGASPPAGADIGTVPPPVIAGPGALPPEINAAPGVPPPLIAHGVPVNPAVLTEISKDPDRADDFIRFVFLPVGLEPTMLAGPAALRAFMSYTAFFEPPLPLAKAVRYPGLEPVEDQSFVAFRCEKPNLDVLQPFLAKWPEVFNAVLLDFGAQLSCPPPPPLTPPSMQDLENEILCIVESFDDTPMRTASQVLKNVYDTAAMITSRPELQATLRTLYGIDIGFSGLGLGIEGSGNPQFVMTAENVLDHAIIPEYLVKNVSIADAGCRCIIVPPYPGRDRDPVDPDFVWQAGTPPCQTVPRLRLASASWSGE